MKVMTPMEDTEPTLYRESVRRGDAEQ